MFPNRILYFSMFLLLLVNAGWIMAAGFGIKPHSIDNFIVIGLTMAGIMITLRFTRSYKRFPDRYRPAIDKSVIAIEGLFFTYFSWVLLSLFGHLIMSTTFPYTDEALMRADLFLHLDWAAYFTFVATHPFINHTLAYFYVLLIPFTLAAFITLVIFENIRKAEFFVATYFTASLICILLGTFFPALGATKYMITDPELLKNFGPMAPGTFHISFLEMMRGTRSVVIDFLNLPGLVTFPSFHTGGAIIVAWCFRRSPLFWLVLPPVLLIIAATPIFGAHYFVDLIGGAAVAFAVLLCFQRLPAYQGIFVKSVEPEPVKEPPEFQSCP